MKMNDRFQQLLAKYPRIAIGGGPKTGKTTLAGQCADRATIHTDDYMDMPWVDQPALLIAACDGLDHFLIEGVQVGRCLRKGLEVDCVIWLREPKAELGSAGARRMAKGCETVFADWLAKGLDVPAVYL